MVPTASFFYRLAHLAFALLVCVVALTSVVVAAIEIEGAPSPHAVAPVVAVAAPARPADVADPATPRAADLVSARNNVNRLQPLLVTADLEVAFGATTTPDSMIAATAANVEVTVTNTGLATWASTGEHAVHLSYHWFAADGGTVEWDGTRANLAHDIAPGDAVTLVVDLRAPRNDGSYILAWDMVKEGSGWFSATSTAMKKQPVAVAAAVAEDELRAVARQAAVNVGLDPVIFERQIQAESGFDRDATSPAGARGIAQITPATARSWGVDTSDPVASLQVAAEQMARYVQRYGDYAMALAAYNAGPGNVERYGGVPPFAETRRYIAKILGGQ